MAGTARAGVGIIIPTRNNRAHLGPCLASIHAYTVGVPYHIYLVNNGQPGSLEWAAHPDVTIVEHSLGKGWVDGLLAGWCESSEDTLLFLNDDTLILPAMPYWLTRMHLRLQDAQLAAVGPSSNTVSGPQSIWHQQVPLFFRATYLIGFCMMVRRSAVQRSGGLDPSLQSADDLDLSYRLRMNGYGLLGDRSIFVHHTGFVTGSRLYGPASSPWGYNSPEWSARDAVLLTAKHGPGVMAYLFPAGVPEAYHGPRLPRSARDVLHL